MSLVAQQHRGRTVLIWVERILLVSGLTFVTFYAAMRLESWFASRAALKQFARANVPNDSETGSGGANLVWDDANGSSEPLQIPDADFRLWSEQRIKAYKDGVRSQSGIPLAVLRIPKSRLEAPVFDGTDELTLNHAVGHIAGTARPGEAGNIGIAGHRDGFFRGLKDLSVGEAIELATVKGTVTYFVDRIQIVSPRHVQVLRPTSVPTVTLVTCYPFYFFGSAPQRYIVTASLLREIESGSTGKPRLGPPTQISTSKRRINEQSE